MDEMLKCTAGCGHELPEDDLQSQVSHMEEKHPKYLKDKLKREGLWNWRTDEPLYPKTNDPLAQH